MKATCIPRADLGQFIQGQLASDRLSQIAEHVDSCEDCQDTVVALAADSDTFAGALQAAQVETPFEKEAALRQGIRRMGESLRRFSFRSDPEQTAAYIYQIGPYVLEESLGNGGMGTVYRAVHSKLKRDVAVKLLPETRWTNTAAITRFEREMEAIGQLDHPNIVRASDAGEDQGMHYLVMDYVDGLDLSRLSSRLGPLPIADACELARQAAEGLQYVHDNGLVHRDIKPSNLMLAWNRAGNTFNSVHGDSPHASLRILDLGLALLGDEHLQDVCELTSVGQLMGTLDYMSPEQGIDSHGVDHRTDIYGLGATLFKLLTGRAPYADPRYGSLIKKMTALATKSAPSVSEFRDDLPKPLVAVVNRMLVRDPDDRFGSAAEVAAALAPLAKGAQPGRLLERGLAAASSEEQSLAVVQTFGPRPESRVSGQGEAQPRLSSGRGNGIRRFVQVAAAAGAILLAAFVYYISTDYGNVAVTSEQKSLQVNIKRSDGSVQSLEVEHGENQTRVRAGHYVVEIEGDVSNYEITPAEFELRRGEQQAVAISLRDHSTTGDMTAKISKPLSVQAGQPNGLSSSVANRKPGGPTYSGKDWDEWARSVEASRDGSTLQTGFKALAILADDSAKLRQSAELICQSMRTHGGVKLGSFGGGYGGDFGGDDRLAIANTAVESLLRLGPEHTIDVLIEELASRNRRSSSFIRQFFSLKYSPIIGDPLEQRNYWRGLTQQVQQSPESIPPNWVPAPVKVSLIVINAKVWGTVSTPKSEFRAMPLDDLIGLLEKQALETIPWELEVIAVGDVERAVENLHSTDRMVSLQEVAVPDETPNKSFDFEKLQLARLRSMEAFGKDHLKQEVDRMDEVLALLIRHQHSATARADKSTEDALKNSLKKSQLQLVKKTIAVLKRVDDPFNSAFGSEHGANPFGDLSPNAANGSFGGKDDTFGPVEDARSDDNPFGAAGDPSPEDDPFGSAGDPSPEDDPFGSAGGPSPEDDPFGSAGGPSPEDDPFGDPQDAGTSTDEDPFG